MYDYTYYDYGYGYDYGYNAGEAATGLAAFGIGMLIMWLISMAISVFTIVCNWKVFKKAGKPGWASIIPIYNTIVMIEIAELPLWYIALFFVPFANIYAIFKINIEIAKKFGKSAGFGVGMTLLQPIFLAILAFSKDAVYGSVSSVSQTAYQQPVQPQFQPQQPIVEPAPVMPAPDITPIQPQPMYQQPVETPVVPTPTVEPVQPEINQNPTIAFCTNCGKPLLPNARFCTNCGKQI